MKLYNALIRRDDANKIDDIKLLSERFSFSAFIFGGLWFVFHKMWRVALFVFLANLLLAYFEKFGAITKIDAMLLDVALFVLIALNANYWFGKFLCHKNYQQVGFVLARNDEEARLKAMELLLQNYPNLSFDSFSPAIIDPQAHQAARKAAQEPYFTV